MNIKLLNEFLNDIKDHKFNDKKDANVKNRNNTNLIKLDKRYDEVKNMLIFYYVEEQWGIKYMVKYLKLSVSYTILRTSLTNYFDIKLRSYKEKTNHISKIRKEKAIYEATNKIGWQSLETQNKKKNKNYVARGLQGYYFNKSFNKYVWLRSSWEYIYAKWLDEKNIIWDVECKTYKLSNNHFYRPDFFIFNNLIELKIIKIVEIKGYWKDKVYKYEELKDQLLEINLPMVLITDIKPYSDHCCTLINEWRKTRILNKNKIIT
jgi:hypothetical protein